MSPEHSRPTPGNQAQRQELARLRNREFVVERNGKLPETGWKIEAVTEDTNGNLHVNLSDRTRGLTKSVSADKLLSWQPSPEDDLVEDTVSNPRLWEDLETEKALTGVPVEIREELGAEALEQVVATPEVVEVAKEKPENDMRAEAKITEVIGEENSGGGTLGELLRTIAAEPEEIRAKLDQQVGDKEAREAVLATLRTRMAMLLAQGGKFHERVQRNNPKELKDAPLGHGHDRKQYTSEEYAVRLALAKLDGSFDYKKSESDTPKELPRNHSHSGQHRQAADTLLESFIEEQNDDKQGTEYEQDQSEEVKRLKTQLDELQRTFMDTHRVSVPYIDQLRYLSEQPTIDSGMMKQAINELSTKHQEFLEQAMGLQQEIQHVQTQAESATLDDVATAHKIEDAGNRLRTSLEAYSQVFGYNGFGFIEQLLDQMQYDHNMQLEFRSRVGQTIDRMAEAQSMFSSTLGDIRI